MQPGEAGQRVCRAAAGLLEDDAEQWPNRSLPALWALGRARELCGQPAEAAAAYAALRATSDDWGALAAGAAAASLMNRLELLAVRELADKRRLTTNIRALGSGEAAAWPRYPETFVLPEEQPELAAATATGWVVKPAAGSDGKALGLKIHSAGADVPLPIGGGAWVAQRRVPSRPSRPLLLDGRRVTIRLYLVMTSASPLRVALHTNGHVLLAGKPFVAGQEHFADSAMQFVGAGKAEPPLPVLDGVLVGPVDPAAAEIGGGGRRRTLAWLEQHAAETGLDFARLWAALRRSAAATVVSAELCPPPPPLPAPLVRSTSSSIRRRLASLTRALPCRLPRPDRWRRAGRPLSKAAAAAARCRLCRPGAQQRSSTSTLSSSTSLRPLLAARPL